MFGWFKKKEPKVNFDYIESQLLAIQLVYNYKYPLSWIETTQINDKLLVDFSYGHYKSVNYIDNNFKDYMSVSTFYEENIEPLFIKYNQQLHDDYLKTVGNIYARSCIIEEE